MFFNDNLTRLKPVRATDPDGYITADYTPAGDAYPCDRQPYTNEEAYKEHGIDSQTIVCRCFLPPAARFIPGEPIRFTSHGTVYTVIKCHAWENHTEVILSCPKTPTP